MDLRGLIIVFACTALLSCREEVYIYDVQPEFQPYLNDFLNEGQARGKSFDLSERDFILIFKPSGEPSTSAAGECNVVPGDSIIIDQGWWNSFDPSQKEVLIYHELGHCVLGRHHDDSKLRTNECKSLMTAIIGGNNCSMNIYSEIWRTFYLDELFGISDEPEWLHKLEGFNDHDFSYDTIIEISYNPILSYESPPINLADNFEIEYTFHKGWEFQIVLSQPFINDIFSAMSGTSAVRIYENEKTFHQNFMISEFAGWEDSLELKRTIRVVDGIVYFYLNEVLMHSMEYPVQVPFTTGIPKMSRKVIADVSIKRILR